MAINAQYKIQYTPHTLYTTYTIDTICTTLHTVYTVCTNLTSTLMLTQVMALFTASLLGSPAVNSKSEFSNVLLFTLYSV